MEGNEQLIASAPDESTSAPCDVTHLFTGVDKPSNSESVELTNDTLDDNGGDCSSRDVVDQELAEIEKNIPLNVVVDIENAEEKNEIRSRDIISETDVIEETLQDIESPSTIAISDSSVNHPEECIPLDTRAPDMAEKMSETPECVSDPSPDESNDTTQSEDIGTSINEQTVANSIDRLDNNDTKPDAVEQESSAGPEELSKCNKNENQQNEPFTCDGGVDALTNIELNNPLDKSEGSSLKKPSENDNNDSINVEKVTLNTTETVTINSEVIDLGTEIDIENTESQVTSPAEVSEIDKSDTVTENTISKNNSISSTLNCPIDGNADEPDLEVLETTTVKPTRKFSLLNSSLLKAVPDAQGTTNVCIFPQDSAGQQQKSISVIQPNFLESAVEPLNQFCWHCKKMKSCGLKLGSKPLCSEECQRLYKVHAAEELAQRVCQQCKTPISSTQFTWQTMDFCSDICIAHYEMFIGSRCVHCSQIPVPAESFGKYCIRYGCDPKQFCGRTCLEQFKKGTRLCNFCDNQMVNPLVISSRSDREFCSSECLRKYVMATKREEKVNACAVCSKLTIVAFEVQLGTMVNSLCSEPCYTAFKFVNKFSEERCEQCRKIFDNALVDKLVIFIDELPLHFCTKNCFNIYITETRQIEKCPVCKVKKNNFDMVTKADPTGPMITCSLKCMRILTSCVYCSRVCKPLCEGKVSDGSTKYFCTDTCGNLYKENGPGGPLPVVTSQDAGVQAAPEIYQHIIVKSKDPPEVKNKSVLCKPYMNNKGTSCRPMPCNKECQTDEKLNPPKLIPIPVPIYIPAPIAMYSTLFPIPLPIPLPVPVPIFIPTTRNSSKGILKEIKKIHEKMPADPFEAELLMMAEMVAGDKKEEVTDSESDREDHVVNDVTESYSPEPVDTNNSFGDDIMQMALFASDLAEPQVDMESVLASNTITPSQHPTDDPKTLYGGVPEESPHTLAMRNRKRPIRGGRGGGGTPQQNKRGRRAATPNDVNMHHNMHHNMGMGHHMAPAEPPRLEVEKPDAHLQLKYTFGVNAWRHWVMQKNQELEKAMLTNRKIKPFKPDLLQLTADELNFSLCFFVKEVKKPNGQEYAPDTIYYLCLGIQQYLFENGRIDNIFTDIYYEKFTDCLDEVAKKFAALYNDSQFIVTRVEEEHLWESRQLGAHSPHVLLSTLMFFNTKHFNLVTVEEHMQLSFSHIMKHWKRNPNTPGVTKVPGSRNVLLRFYPPQAALEANSRKKKVYEQQENEVDPLRCPVKLYEFYLSKCPESVKTRNDVFYLLPERSCVPDSPVWYSTMALGKEPLMKMLHRVKMVKEINVALLNS